MTVSLYPDGFERMSGDRRVSRVREDVAHQHDPVLAERPRVGHVDRVVSRVQEDSPSAGAQYLSNVDNKTLS